jgi:hypothetical protein
MEPSVAYFRERVHPDDRDQLERYTENPAKDALFFPMNLL